ncbi:MAG: helix-turn-helix domain-containing protein [Planctomycetaceae bacterium]|nr:helix-turn-helix domain-containing protein [Phycisphaerales bacterium]MCE2652055.1 helix-turn-helix domain-containing protein [Planctomycetaceae bacterium]
MSTPRVHPFDAPAASEWLGGCPQVPTVAPDPSSPSTLAALLLTESDVGNLLQISDRSVQSLRERGVLVPVKIAGLRRVLYRRADVEAFVAGLPVGGAE